MFELMATMVTKSCKRKLLAATPAHQNHRQIRDKPLPNKDEKDGKVSTTLKRLSPNNLTDSCGFDGEWFTDSSETNAAGYVIVSTDDFVVNLNSSNNTKVRSRHAKITAVNGKRDHDESAHFPRNQKLSPMKRNDSLARGSVTSKEGILGLNEDGLLSISDCGENFNKSLHPEVADVKIGATEFMSALGMRPLVCPFGYVEHRSGPELALSFVLSLGCLISTNFSWRSKTTQSCNEYSFQVLQKSQVTFRLRFPYQGFYTLEVYAQRKSTNESPKSVFNYVIHAPDPDGESIVPFPKAHKDWCVAGFVLKEPLNGDLPSNSHSKFALRVLRALNVFATTGGGVSVDLQEHEGSWWIGLVDTGVAPAEIVLYAVFTVKSQTPVPLLSFRVVPAPDGRTTMEMSAFGNEIVSLEKKRLEQLLSSNREWLTRILEEEQQLSNDTIAAHKARLLKLSRKQPTKTGHTKLRFKLKPLQQNANLRELLKNEQRILEKLRSDCQQRFRDIRRVETETIASIEAGGKKAIQEIKKSLHGFLHGLNVPQDKVTERLGSQIQLMSELEVIQVELVSRNTWAEEFFSEISDVHERTIAAVKDLQESTLASLGLAVSTHKVRESSREMIEGEILKQLERTEQEQLKELTDDAKAYIDGTGEMKHSSITQIYSLQIDEMQLQDAWIKSHEMGIFELQQINSPVSEIANYLQTEIEEETRNCKNRLRTINEAVLQQARLMDDEYKQKLSQFQTAEQEKLREYETKLETMLADSCGADTALLDKLSPKSRETVFRLENHLSALVQEIEARDLSTFVSIRDAIANNVLAEVEQAQTEMFENSSRIVSTDNAGKQIVNIDFMNSLDPIHRESFKHANRVLRGDFPADATHGKRIEGKPEVEALPRGVQKTRKGSRAKVLHRDSSGDESECDEEVDNKSPQAGRRLTEVTRCSFLVLGKSDDCKDTVLKLIEESTDRLKETSGRTSSVQLQKQSAELKGAQLLMTKAVLRIEDMLTIETKEILRYIVREVYENFQGTMSTLKKIEENNLLQVRRVKRESMFEIKHWLKQRLSMMVAHDAKTAAKLKSEITSMIDEMEKLGHRRIACIKEAFDKNEAKIRAHYHKQEKVKSGVLQEGQNDVSAVLGQIRAIHERTVAELDSKVKSCYKSIKEEAITEFQKVEVKEQIQTNNCKTRVHELFWKNVQEGEREVFSELQNYCSSKESEEAEIAHDCVNGEEQTMDLIRTDLTKKCNDINRLETRNRMVVKKLEDSRIEEVASLLKDSPWLWSEVRKEEDDRLLESRIHDEERLFEFETRQEEALTSLRSSREMTYSQIENRFREKRGRLRKEFLAQGADYFVDEKLTGKVRNVQEKILLAIETIHKEALKRIKTNDHNIFREMEIEVSDTFEKLSIEYQAMYSSAKELQDEVYEPFRTLEEQIRLSNRVELSEADVGDIMTETRANLFKVLEDREKSHVAGWLESVSFNGLRDALNKEVNIAELMLVSLNRIDELKNAAISLDIRKMLKVLKQFKLPQRTIHEALKGVLLTLGDHEGFTGEWKNCMRRITPIGTTKLKWRVKKFIISELDPRIARRTVDILTEVAFEKVEEISPELLKYCEWALAICEERLEMAMRSGLRTPEPAHLNEQVQIFKRKYNSKGPVAGPRVLLFPTDETLSRHTDQMLEQRKKKLVLYKEKESREDDRNFYQDF